MMYVIAMSASYIASPKPYGIEHCLRKLSFIRQVGSPVTRHEWLLCNPELTIQKVYTDAVCVNYFLSGADIAPEILTLCDTCWLESYDEHPWAMFTRRFVSNAF